MNVESPNARRSAAWTIAAALTIAVSAWAAGLFETLDRAFFDLQTRWLQHEVVSDVVIVEIDARSLKELGHWPLARSSHARLIESLDRGGAKRIFLDIDFSARSTPIEDARLAAALATVRATIVLPAFWQPTSNGAPSLTLSEPLTELRAHAQLGLVNLVPGTDGLVREITDPAQLPAAERPVWTLFQPAAEHRVGALQLDFRIAPSSFQRISYVDVLRGLPEHRLDGKSVFVGATALELGDIVAVPVHRALPGVVLQAIAYESARSGGFRALPVAAVILGLIPWCGLCVWLLSRRRWHSSPLAMVLLLVAGLGATVLFYATVSVAIPITPFIVAAVVVLTGSLLGSLNVEAWHSWRARLRSREQDSLLRQVVAHSSDAILTLDADGVVKSANRAAQAMLEANTHTLIGSSLMALSPQLMDTLNCSPDVAHSIKSFIDRPNGERIALEVGKAKLRWEQQEITTLTLRDITVQEGREAALRYMARHDALTKLPNRVFLAEQLEAAFLKREGSTLIALLMLDLDGFKEVNDTLGHSMGDALMSELGLRLKQFANADRHVARVGGDEFAVLWSVQGADMVEELAQQLLLLVEEPILIKGIPVSLGTSIGIATSPDHASDPESLLKHADVALYVAKRKKSRVEFYDPSADTSSPRRLEMLTLLRAAVSKGELALHFQPKVSMQTGAVTEVEALCRWNSPVFGHVSPAEFIPLAEASDVIKSLTEWTIRESLVECRVWHDAGVDLKVAVNLSARHMQDAHLPHWLRALLSETHTRPEWLELEITESAIMMDPDRAARILLALREMGVKISIDDFGTGYSSLAYLRTLAVDRLKIDRSFIAGMDKGHKEQIIVESTIKLAHGLGLQAVAEGIENESQYSILRALHCDFGQGYLIARPMPSAQLIDWYRSKFDDAQSADAEWEVPGTASLARLAVPHNRSVARALPGSPAVRVNGV